MAKAIDINSLEYPRNLKDTDHPPKKLYYHGDWNPDLFEKVLGVVGSRDMTPYGNRVVKNLMCDLSLSCITILSGFMSGIDSSAHKYAIEFNLPTIAIVPCGINTVYPPENRSLWEEILNSKGLIISEWEGYIPPKKWVFPKRNRIVAGLCDALLVVEAGKKSGSLITADYAHKFQRKVFSVPGNIFSQHSLGTNELLTLYGIPYVDSKIINRHFMIKEVMAIHGAPLHSMYPINNTVNSSEKYQRKIISILNAQPLNMDNICEHLELDSSAMSNILMHMEASDLIKEFNGLYYVC